MAKLILFFLLICKTSAYSFYDFYGDVPFQYQVVFTGEVIISSHDFHYTNNSSSFVIDYSINTKSEFSTIDQIVMDLKFSKIRTDNIPPIFVALLDGVISQQMDDIAYIVKLNNDRFLAVKKNGENHSLGYFLEILFPIVNLEQKPYSHDLNVETKNKEFINFKTQGVDYQNYKSAQESFLLVETNDAFINKVYQEYSTQRNSQNPPLFWLQQMRVNQFNTYHQLTKEFNTLGMYFIDKQARIVDKALLVSKFSFSTPMQIHSFRQDFNISLEGEFDIQLISK